MTQANSVVVVRLQCLVCGRAVGQLAKAQVNVSSLRPFDHGLQTAWSRRRDDYWRQRREQEERGRAAADAEWWARYDQYLRSPEWAALRRKALARDQHLCQGCRQSTATQVHHLTYARVGREMLFDLVSVCDDCHRRIHPDEE